MKNHKNCLSFVASGISLLIVLLFVCQADAALAPPSSSAVLWETNGHYYEYIRTLNSSDRLTWDDAAAAAEAMSTEDYRCHLVTLNTTGENSFVYNNAMWNGNNPTNAWLGGFQDKTTGDTQDEYNTTSYWRWVAGDGYLDHHTSEQYNLFWRSGEPNDGGTDNVENGDEDYMIYSHYGAWNDVPGDTLRWYVVEYEPVPIPSAMILFVIGLAGLFGTRIHRKR